MQIGLSENNGLPQHEGKGKAATHLDVETPVKKSRAEFHSQLKTAETPTLMQALSSTKRSIADVDAQELFDNFSRIVAVSESQEQFEEADPYRRLEYEQQGRLDFEQSTNSMRKKRRGSRLVSREEAECIRVKPFLLDGENESPVNEKQQARQAQEECPNEGYSPQLRKRASKGGVMTTPTKKPVRQAELEGAAKKECPFRDLEPRRSLF